LTVKRDTSSSTDGPAIGLTTAAARTVLAPLEDSGGRVELIARRLGTAIRRGLILDGERLPPEAELAAQLGVSTVTLREALMILREQGLVTTRRGRAGGSFVRAPADLREPLRCFSVNELRDLGDQRGALMGAAARLAAQRAQPEEIQRLEDQVRRLRGAAGASERRRANAELTIAIAVAAQSTRLTHEEARLRSEVGDLLQLDLGEIDHDALVSGLQRLVEAIARRRSELARDLAEAHVAWETERLIELRLLLPDRLAGDGTGGSADALLGEVADELDRVFGALDDLGARFARLVARAAGAPRRDDLDPLRARIFALIETHPELVTGAGVVTAPQLLADAPRWLEWWWTSTRGVPEALRVNLDPTAPDFYDYTTADWYATPSRTREPRLSGPSVDYACTNQYAVTMAVPVVAADAFLGIAAADVLVASLERRLAPALAALGGPAALTNAEGRVIAANTPAVVPGQRVRLSRAAARRASARSPVRSWLLVETPR
jgi:DNA-binding FadR family transcriptional regulator